MTEKEEIKLYRTSLGRLSYPYLTNGFVRVDPKTGEKKESWGVQILVTPEVFKAECLQLVGAVNECGKKEFGPKWELKTSKNPCIQKTDDMETKDDRTKGLVCIKCKSRGPIVVLGPDGKKLDSTEIGKIKGGHWGRAVVNPYSYDFSGNKGVSLGIHLLQYWKPDEEFGMGITAALNMIDSLEVPLSDPDPGLMNAAMEIV